MACIFQEPLKNILKIKGVAGCGDLHPILTNQGLCYSFNGIESGMLWKNSKLIQSFNEVFGTYQPTKKLFNGIGQSKGKF